MELPIHIDRMSSRSMQSQLAGQLAAMMLAGRLPAGMRLPSTRALAADLAVSRNVVLAAYDELFAEGYVEGRQGSGTFVVHDLPAQPQPAPRGSDRQPRWLAKPTPPAVAPVEPAPGMIDFRLGRPSMEAVSRPVWRALWREISTDRPPDTYGPPAGYPELREAVARYVARSRGFSCDPDAIVITSGSLQAVNLIAQATLQRGDSVAFEEPGYPTSRAALTLHGARIVPIPVDDDGMYISRLADLEDAPPLAYVTPSHQYPTGARMSVVRRLELLAWARRTDSLIIEDDYDGELRFDAAPLPALASLEQGAAHAGRGPGRVAYVGTFSKTLTPALRVGYVIAPPALRDRLIEIKRLTDFQTAWPLQRILTAFIDNDRFRQHIRRVRRRYGEKRALLSRIFAPLDGVARLQGLEAGLHAYLELASGIDADAVEADALQGGVRVSTIAAFYVGTPDRNGLLLGYGGLSLDAIERGAMLLTEAIRVRC